MKLGFGENAADEPMQTRSGRQQNRNDDPDAACQRGTLHRKPAEQDGGRQRDLGRQPRIIVAAAPIGDGDQGDDSRGRDRKQHLAADEEADRAGERGDREGAQSGRRARWTGAFAAFPLGADQQADTKCDREVEKHGIDDAGSFRPPKGRGAGL